MNLIPMFVTHAEVMTFAAGGDMAIIKFFYKEPEVPRDYTCPQLGLPSILPAVTIILPRVAAKEMVNRMSGFFANQDEHAKPRMICRTCKVKDCPMRDEVVMNPDRDGCSKWVGDE